MSLFDKIKHAIFGDHGPLGQFGHDQPTAAPAPAAPSPATPSPAAPSPATSSPAAPAAAAPAAPAAPPPPAAGPVDVEAILSAKAEAAGRPSNWRTSIVDLLTLLGLDASLAARKELADDLNVHVGADGSAEQNVALHKAVMKALAANGGKVPADLLN